MVWVSLWREPFRVAIPELRENGDEGRAGHTVSVDATRGRRRRDDASGVEIAVGQHAAKAGVCGGTALVVASLLSLTVICSPLL